MALHAAGRQSLVDTVVEQLRAQLTSGEWAVGDRLPTEHALAETLQVGRNTVREAVRVLVHSGMLRSRQGEGTFVVSVTDPASALRAVQRSSIRDVLELRTALEAEAARLAALRREPADLERMRSALDAQLLLRQENGPGAGDTELYADHDVAFHRAIVDAARNTALTALYDWFAASVREALVASLADREMARVNHADHRALLDAIACGDPAAAEAASRALLERPLRQVEELLADD
ncbi:FadR/GntR family transcriptional regulator [Streptomyces sp. G-5]|jgi:DNA-binding FadR family transcriptional regulator|uniref:FadR/GntR family transcriptional regulator n=1 Tax=Streptomyces TaxID=1883 RepID=UPI0021D0D361|nr:FCD domain-containing protein [Streptomyces sp. G-5]MCU4749540.1 FCD domain-containing protein [Streptomyces sp. G-5]